jgi:hypothetical protein
MTDVIASPAIREMIIKTVRDTTSILLEWLLSKGQKITKNGEQNDSLYTLGWNVN